MLQHMEGTPQLQAESFNEALVDAPVEVFEFGPKNVAPVPLFANKRTSSANSKNL